jgi:protein arginine N-methyltransferase 1
MRIEYHRTLIADTVRNEAFRSALAAVIEPGRTTVADIGAGTGLLGLIAAQLGAREVHLYEAAEVAGVAAETLRRNKAKGCHLYPCHSTAMEDPPRVDVVVSETLGNYAFEENILATMRDAVARHLNPGGVVIPRRILQFVAPVATPRIHAELTAWSRVGHGIDLAHAERMSLNNIYVRVVETGELLGGMSGARQWDAAHLAKKESSTRKGEATWPLQTAHTIYGFAIWWSAELVTGITLSTAPNAPRTHWEQLYLPLLEPLAGGPGDSISVAIRSRTSEEEGTVLKWTATQRRKDGTVVSRQALDLEKGYLP